MAGFELDNGAETMHTEVNVCVCACTQISMYQLHRLIVYGLWMFMVVLKPKSNELRVLNLTRKSSANCGCFMGHTATLNFGGPLSQAQRNRTGCPPDHC